MTLDKNYIFSCEDKIWLQSDGSKITYKEQVKLWREAGVFDYLPKPDVVALFKDGLNPMTKAECDERLSRKGFGEE